MKIADMTEEQIERHAERRMDALDHRYLSTSMDQDEYQREVDAIDRECQTLLQSARRAAE